VSLFEIEKLAPGVAVFGMSFITLFSATLIARDRESSFLQRLYTTPLRPSDYILGYLLPILPIAMAQAAVSYCVAFALGLRLSWNIALAVLASLPVCVFYVSLGLLCGCLLNVKQVGGICGALLTNLSAWLSGIWFDIDLVGDTFKSVAKCLPFLHAVELERAIVGGFYEGVLQNLFVVCAYALLLTVAAILVFLSPIRKSHGK
jgi:ABC-2 type transport system permease protein